VLCVHSDRAIKSAPAANLAPASAGAHLRVEVVDRGVGDAFDQAGEGRPVAVGERSRGGNDMVMLDQTCLCLWVRQGCASGRGWRVKFELGVTHDVTHCCVGKIENARKYGRF
jgi:hypothetical protein